MSTPAADWPVGPEGAADPALAARFRRAARALGAGVAAVGALALVGWFVGIPLLTRLHPSLASMKANTACALLLAGLAVRTLAGLPPGVVPLPRGARVAGWSVCALTGLTLLEWIVGGGLGFDEALVRDPATPAGQAPGRMSVATAGSLLMVGAVLSSAGVAGARALVLRQGAILLVLTVAFLALLGYAYGVRALYAIAPFASLALHTAGCLLLLALGLLFARPEHGVMAIFARATPAGRFARRTIPALVGVLVTLGGVVLGGEHGGWYEKAFGTAVFVAVTTVLLTAVAWWSAVSLDRGAQILAATEARLRQTQKMEAIGRLAGGVAHDFNNLLVAILGYAEFARRRVAGDAGAVADLDEVRRAAERATDLTRQLLAFSRRQILQPRRVDLNTLTQGTEKMLRRVLGEHIRIRLRLASQPAVVHADPGQLEQVILNLAVNARDAMPGGGDLVLETAHAVLDADYCEGHPEARPGPHACLAVTDTGHGMTPEIRARLFEPFFTTKPVGQGTGLGLSTVFGIVKQSGGTVYVYSEPGRGTTFKVYLPRADAPAEAAAAPAVPRPAGGTETVLVAEDAEPLRALIRRVLTEAGYRVLLAADAAAARRLATDEPGPIPLLVTDVVMPGGNGADLARDLTAARRELRVLFMSGYTEDGIARHGILDPGVNFLPKPFAPDLLLQRVREVLDAPATPPA